MLVLSLCSPVMAENVYDGSTKLVFSRFLLLESSLDRGRWLSLDKNTPGVMAYFGGELPALVRTPKKMYTFKTTFMLVDRPADADRSAADVGISLYMGLTDYPYALYLNGTELFRKGRFAGAAYNSSIRAAYEVLLPPSLLRRDRLNELVLEAYPRYETAALDTLYLDRSESVSQAVFLRNFLGINLVQGAFVLSLIIGLYFFILYLAEKKRQKTRLIFALFCFSYFFASIAIATFHDTSNEVMMENLSKFGLLLSSTCLLRFFMEFTGIFNRNIAFRWFVNGFGLAAALGALFQRSKESLLVWFGWGINLLIVPEMILCAAILLLSVFRDRRKGSLLLLLAFAVLLSAIVHDVSVLARNAMPYAWLITYGYFAIVLAIFALLAEEQARLYHESLQSEADILVDRNRIEILNERLIRQKDSFYRFVPTEFLQLLGRDSVVDIKLGDSSLRYLTILFTDIRGFTSIAEKMSPIEIFEFLNAYLVRMEKAVQVNGGFVDKYIGDGVMAIYSTDRHGAGNAKATCADNSLASASQIRLDLELFNAELRSRGIEPIRVGLGINTGDVTLGTVGSDTRLDTTVIGDAVNLASRLESLTKYYRIVNLISEYTVDALTDPGRFALRLIDTVSVPGRTKPLRIYELLEPSLAEDAGKIAAMKDLSAAIAEYLARDFTAALNRLAVLAARDPADSIVALYADRCAEYLAHPPAADWDGVFRITEKAT